jgi:signal peptidase I
MQCVACGFENLPGLERCARCGSPLDLDAIAVEPPRASTLRLGTRAARVRNTVGRHVRTSLPSLAPVGRWLRYRMPADISMRGLCWSLLPGGGPLATGRPRLGWVLIAAWCVCLLAALLMVGTATGWFLLGLAVSVHAAGVFAVMATNLVFERLWIRAVFGLVAYTVLFLFLYRPVAQLGMQFVIVVPVTAVGAPGVLADGDALLATGPWLERGNYARGDIVLYEIPEISGDGYQVPAGRSVDRIVGLPGDQVEIVGGKLLINGQPPAAGMMPLGPVPRSADVDWTLGPYEYAVLPSQVEFHMPGDPREAQVIARSVLSEASRMSSTEIVGRVWWRWRPFDRFGALE